MNREELEAARALEIARLQRLRLLLFDPRGRLLPGARRRLRRVDALIGALGGVPTAQPEPGRRYLLE